ncbi:ras association domain-containing protein 8-like [Brienomyrus brachyistius]|uniref:ras association domain-containing protein 8-like n=1 Tax=Brienomyrus brachyistius TaxID=42636 RepID=UPI0020B41B1E|nr:ras association domain-containing protein 8-like [Brienomyrus brachyistius]XP_048825721.1 ras association domain-containing protein 8-like [Brienomyrus brachyistius]XP_048825722.1 ras association domain-containing protein 8-like [Brienomyrus brachyistius]
MELKVWVDGVLRVLCGLSEETSCQDVVITLAKAMGQTGRYVLIQRLRDYERQLLANEKLLDSMTKLGQQASDIQFFLRRIGPINQDRTVSDKGITSPKLHVLEPHKHKEPRRSHTFNLGHSSSLKKKPKHLKRSAFTPPPCSSVTVSKDELFQQVLQQQARLHDLEVHLNVMEQEMLVWEQMTASDYELPETKLEAKLEQKLCTEEDQELALNHKLRKLHQMLDSYDTSLQDLTAHTGHLEKEIELENIRRQSFVALSNLEESLGSVKVELKSEQKHGEELESSLTELEKVLGSTEALLQTKTEEMDKLNKELRQCNLQQFIQQTGTHIHTDLEHLEKIEKMHLLPKGSYNGSGSCHAALPPQSTAKRLLGHPRNLLDPLISSLNPEGVFV